MNPYPLKLPLCPLLLQAARDAYEQMGARLFYDQCLQDTLQQKQHRVSSEVDVTTLKDYMHYLSLLDETPAYMGGRDNSWRKLTLEGEHHTDGRLIGECLKGWSH